MTLNDYEMKKFQESGEILVVMDDAGNRLWLSELQVGWGGVGNNRANNTITIDGKLAKLTDGNVNEPVGYRHFEFV